MKLTLDAMHSPLAEIDLGEPAEKYGYFDEGDLSSTAGNLYLYIDGKEVGSLFFFREEDGRVTVTLGAFDPTKEQWDEANPLVMQS